ncbi:hypothetical protein B0T24DRAFT_416437 [Lasiosphaeria ovina]|uniref:Uncharacterized protein n=1 Tax=Lasiosphaeria ovina TaxID=92902 RepID=A0AAE0JYC9_9PEZI|nr:hypothetical protein B0T24DRAFT_416437 [Lasiosphaeria ovina]
MEDITATLSGLAGQWHPVAALWWHCGGIVVASWWHRCRSMVAGHVVCVSMFMGKSELWCDFGDGSCATRAHVVQTEAVIGECQWSARKEASESVTERFHVGGRCGVEVAARRLRDWGTNQVIRMLNEGKSCSWTLMLLGTQLLRSGFGPCS